MRKLTEVEKLAGRFPDAGTTARGMFDVGASSAEVTVALNKQFNATLTETQMRRFRKKCWVDEGERVREIALTKKAMVKAFGGDKGLDNVASSQIFEILTTSKDLPKMTKVREMVAKNRAQTLKEKEFRFKTGQLKSPKTQEPDAQEQSRNALQRIKEIFGLAGDEPPKPPVRQLPAAVGSENA